MTNLDYAKMAVTNGVGLAHLIGFTKLTGLHNNWIRLFLTAEKDITLMAHRGSYKTTCLSMAIALHLLLRPNQNIIFVRKTDDDVTEIIEQVKKILLSDVFVYISERIYGYPLKLHKTNASEISTNLVRSARGSVQLLGMGMKASLTGKHADLLITDDIVNMRDRLSRAEREYTKQVYYELQNIKNRGGRLINTGTPWHREDAFSIMPEALRFDCYETGLISRGELEEIRQKTVPSLFAANYELKHIASETALFQTAPRFTDDTKVLRDGIAHIDAAYGGEDGNALTLGKRGKDPEGRDVIYLLGKRREGHIDHCLQEFLHIKNAYKCGTVYCEENADKGYVKQEIRRAGQMSCGYFESMNKGMKIATNLKKWWDRIIFLEDTDPTYIAEILNYSEDADHDDAPDSAACVVRRLDRGERGSLI